MGKVSEATQNPLQMNRDMATATRAGRNMPPRPYMRAKENLFTRAPAIIRASRRIRKGLGMDKFLSMVDQFFYSPQRPGNGVLYSLT